MKQLKVIGISNVKEEKPRSDGKKSRKYYTLYFADAENLLTNKGQRNFFENHTPDGKDTFWKCADPSTAKSLVGTLISGEIVRAEVEPYQIGERMATSTTVVLLKGEFLASIVSQSGHELAGSAASVAAPVAQEATEALQA